MPHPKYLLIRVNGTLRLQTIGHRAVKTNGDAIIDGPFEKGEKE
jgi:hypothetical protein